MKKMQRLEKSLFFSDNMEMMKSSAPNNVGMSGFHGGCVDGWMEREKWGERKRERE